MIIQFTLTSRNDDLLKLVADFAEGLECEVDGRAIPHGNIRARLPEEASADLFLHLVSYVALSAVKLGVDANEPQYQVQFHEPHAKAEVTMAFGVSDIRLR